MKFVSALMKKADLPPFRCLINKVCRFIQYVQFSR